MIEQSPYARIAVDGLVAIYRALLHDPPCPCRFVCMRDWCCIHGDHGNPAAVWLDADHRLAARQFLNAVVWG